MTFDSSNRRHGSWIDGSHAITGERLDELKRLERLYSERARVRGRKADTSRVTVQLSQQQVDVWHLEQRGRRPLPPAECELL